MSTPVTSAGTCAAPEGAFSVKLHVPGGRAYIAQDAGIPVVCLVVHGRTVCIPLDIAGTLAGQVSNFVTLTGAGQRISSVLPTVAPGQLSNGFGELHDSHGQGGDIPATGGLPQVGGLVGDVGGLVEAHKNSPLVGAVQTVRGLDVLKPTVGDATDQVAASPAAPRVGGLQDGAVVPPIAAASTPGGDAVSSPNRAASPPPTL